MGSSGLGAGKDHLFSQTTELGAGVDGPASASFGSDTWCCALGFPENINAYLEIWLGLRECAGRRESKSLVGMSNEEEAMTSWGRG